MEILIVGIIIWLALPVPLFIMWIIAHGREMRQREYLKELYLQHRILPEELIRRGIPLPKQVQMPPPVSVPVDPAAPQIAQSGFLPPQQETVQTDPAQSLADAAARAAKIADAALSGETVTPEILAAEIAAAHTASESAAESLSNPPVTEPEPNPDQSVPESGTISQEKLPVPEYPESGAISQENQPVPEYPESGTISQEKQSVPEYPESGAISQENRSVSEYPEPDSAPAAEQSERTEPEFAEKTEFRASAALAAPVRTAVTLSGNPEGMQPAAVKQETSNLSAITAMLSVGVLLVIFAGLIFVRSAWSSLTDGGRLATLAAGSVLFFGTSALAQRVWKLERTGMAFFTLGAAFLPISVWAAGYLELLGDGLSGPDNPWLIALAFASFTVIALIAVRIYRMKGWGIAFLCGLTVTYLCLAEAFTLHRDMSVAAFLTAVAVYALIFVFGAKAAAPRLPAGIGTVLEPFAFGLGGLAAVGIWGYSLYTAGNVLFESDFDRWHCAVPFFLAAFLFFAPAVTGRLNQWTVLPVSLMTVPAFLTLLSPLYRPVFHWHGLQYAAGSYLCLCLLITALLWLILLQTNSLPDETRGGFLMGAAGLTALSILSQLSVFGEVPMRINLTMAAAFAVMLLVWIFVIRKQNSFLLHVLIGAQVWMLCMIASQMILDHFRDDDWIPNRGYVLAALCFLAGFLLLMLLKKHRTFVSDLLLTVSAAVLLLIQVCNIQIEDPSVFRWGGLVLLGGIVLLYVRLALKKDTCKPEQYAFAAVTPVLLSLTFLLSNEGVLDFLKRGALESCWMLCSFAIGAAVYLTTKKRFNGVRRLLFTLTMAPPIVYAVLVDSFKDSYRTVQWNIVPLAISAAAAFGLWKLFANRGFRKLSTGSFAVGLFLLLDATLILVRDGLYNGEMNYTVLMIASVWILLFGLLTICIRRRMVLLVGGNAIENAMQFITPAAALILSAVLPMLDEAEWESFYFVYAFGMCILAWFTTKKSQIILPGVCALSLLLAIEGLRDHVSRPADGSVVLWILVFCGLTLLIPYLGTVLREAEEEKRSMALTGFGAATPAWLAAAALCGTYAGEYSDEQMRWMLFFVPILISAYLLHFLLFVKEPDRRCALITAAAAAGVIALWMQPLVDVTDTWFEDRLHILPLLLFGLVIRKLYEQPVGGYFLFGVGVYTMLRFGITAIMTEETADLLTLLVTALVMFIASFYIKQKKWFALGGISLVLTAVYMHMKLTEGRQWWVYLLLAGLILIVVAGSNEMLKQRGDSLKSHAGRLWQDWTW